MSVDNSSNYSSNFAQYEEQTYHQQQSQMYPQQVQQMTSARPTRVMQPVCGVRFQQQMQETYHQVVQPGIIETPYDAPIIDNHYQAPTQQYQHQQPLAIAAPSSSVHLDPFPMQQKQHQQHQEALPVTVPPVRAKPPTQQCQLQLQEHLALPAPQHQDTVLQIVQQPAEPVNTDQQQIQILIANSENDAVASSTPKLNETVNLNLVIDDVSNEVTVKNENSEDSINQELKKLAGNINLNINDSEEDSKNDADALIVTDRDADGDNGEKLSDQDVLNLLIHCLKLEDLQHRKKLQHCKHQECYLQNLI